MKEKFKYYFFKLAVMSVYVIGITTVAATSRYSGYQPVEDDEMMNMARKARKH